MSLPAASSCSAVITAAVCFRASPDRSSPRRPSPPPAAAAAASAAAMVGVASACAERRGLVQSQEPDDRQVLLGPAAFGKGSAEGSAPADFEALELALAHALLNLRGRGGDGSLYERLACCRAVRRRVGGSPGRPPIALLPHLWQESLQAQSVLPHLQGGRQTRPRRCRLQAVEKQLGSAWQR